MDEEKLNPEFMQEGARLLQWLHEEQTAYLERKISEVDMRYPEKLWARWVRRFAKLLAGMEPAASRALLLDWDKDPTFSRLILFAGIQHCWQTEMDNSSAIVAERKRLHDSIMKQMAEKEVDRG